MQKHANNIILMLKRWVTKHPILKIIALFLAILVWFYTKNQIISGSF